jgi:hypothetical protein
VLVPSSRLGRFVSHFRLLFASKFHRNREKGRLENRLENGRRFLTLFLDFPSIWGPLLEPVFAIWVSQIIIPPNFFDFLGAGVHPDTPGPQFSSQKLPGTYFRLFFDRFGSPGKVPGAILARFWMPREGPGTDFERRLSPRRTLSVGTLSSPTALGNPGLLYFFGSPGHPA